MTNKEFLRDLIEGALPDQPARDRWHRLGRPIGRPDRPALSGEWISFDLGDLLTWASLGYPEETTLTVVGEKVEESA